MMPQQAFPGRKVEKIKGNGKGKRGTIVEAYPLSGTMLVEFDGTKVRDIANPYEYKSLPPEEKPS